MCSITWKSHLVLTLSNAFSVSKVIMANVPCWFRAACSSIAIAFLMFDVADLPLTKSDWTGCINSGRALANLSATSLERIFASMFNRDIGLYDAEVVGSLPGFGISFI